MHSAIIRHVRRLIRERGRGGIAVVAAFAVAALALPSPAAANYHLTKVSEVYPGTGMTPDDYVELQMYQSGQNVIAGHAVTIYNAAGTLSHTFTFPADVASGQSQRTILLGAGPLANGVEPDFTDPALAAALGKSGGAACFDAIPVDCVAWGNFSGATPLPGAAGAPVAPSGIPGGSSITRSIARGCATLLEAGDDSDDSAADFKVTTDRTPRPNSEPPTEKSCGGGGGGAKPQTEIDKGPKRRTTKAKAKFKFSSPVAGADFECALDGKRFKSCSSPLKLKRLKPGKHVFKVRAVVDGARDGSPAIHRWKILKG